MTRRTKALHWWRSLNDTQRLQVVQQSPRYNMFAKEVSSFQSTSLTGRMIEEIYNDFIIYWKLKC